MRYSRFDEQLGVYHVYEDRRTHALNADLPTPRLPKPENGIGVPSRIAGRPLPSGAKYVGTSWRPLGVIVSGNPSALGGVGDAFEAHPILFVGGAALLAYGAFRLYVSEMARWGER